MKTSDFYYELPSELIAQDPLTDRSASRLLVLDRESGETKEDVFRNIGQYLRAGDVLVINDTKVLPARLYGIKADTGARIEVLLLRRVTDTDWEVLMKPGRKVKEGTYLTFGDGRLAAEVLKKMEEGIHMIRFSFEGIFEEILDSLGEMPLPPYIHHKLKDKNRYQTVYAKVEGSAAAPTAGLHFTPELMDELRAAGIIFAPVTLHVGLGTFRPVKVEDVTQHHMHSEYYVVTSETAEIINRAKDEGRRVICVGTTSCRTVESAASGNGLAGQDAPADGRIRACSGWTDIFIYPGYKFKVMDGLITNFHLPESTLMMLVSAFAGKEHIFRAYAEAVEKRFRFFSFGDAMLIK